jgi:hypothetical protein
MLHEGKVSLEIVSLALVCECRDMVGFKERKLADVTVNQDRRTLMTRKRRF